MSGRLIPKCDFVYPVGADEVVCASCGASEMQVRDMAFIDFDVEIFDPICCEVTL